MIPGAIPTEPLNFLGLDRPALGGLFSALGEKRFRVDQLLQWIHRYRAEDFGKMTNLSKTLRERLTDLGNIAPPHIVSDRLAADGTRKWLLKLGDGNQIETVFIPEPERGTLCISSQAGCQLNCTFCATGQQGFSRNLEVAEILGQVWLAYRLLPPIAGREQPITNVVLMGMGEPLLNFDNVISAVNVMMDDHAYGLSRKRITLSTAGMVPGIDQLRDAVPISLAVSLHAPDDALRSTLVPLNRKYPINQLLAACKRYIAPEANRKVTFEYAMLTGINDSPDQAKALARLMQTVPSKVNLIPFNPFPGTRYQRSDSTAIVRFRDILLRAGIITTVRRTRGDDIAAACGQLTGDVRPRERRAVAAPVLS